LEYIKDEVGPTTEFPCKKNNMPNPNTIVPTLIIAIPIFMLLVCSLEIKGKRNLIK
jgi:hypothetical protein